MQTILYRTKLRRVVFREVRRTGFSHRAGLVAAPLFLMLACLFSHAALAKGLKFEAWTSDDGLPQNSVYSILQTRDGYVWFTTLGGLVRYDGVRFTVFDRATSPGINGNRFTTIYEDSEGVLWAGTEAGDLTRSAGGSFTTYTEADGLPSAEIRAIRGDGGGGLRVLSAAGLFELKGGRFVRPETVELTAEQLRTISTMRRQTGFSFFDREGLHIFERGGLRTYTTRDGIPSLNINAVFEDQRGAFWVETKDAGLCRLKDGKFTVFPVRATSPDDETRMTAAYEDGRGNLWVARRGRGLSVWKDGELTPYTAEDGLTSDDVETIYEDREGNVWLGTFNSGINRAADKAFTVLSERDGLGHKNVYPVLEDRDGAVWVGTWGGELYKFQRGAFTRYGRERGLTYQAVSALYQDAGGTLWVGTFGGGVNRLAGYKFQALTTKDGLPGDNVRAIAQDREGRLWFGTTNGLTSYEGGTFTTYGAADGLPHKEVQALTVDRRGALWVGTLGGIAKLQGGRFTSYTEREGLSSNYVRVIHEDAEGVIWVGTYDGGLTRVKDGRLRAITTRDGLYDNGAFQILEDDAGYFWMSSNRGIYRVARSELNELADGRRQSVTSVHFGKADGLLSAECNGGTQPAGFRARDGRLWFPTQDGVGIVNPSEIVRNDLPPPVAIEEFILDNRPVVFRGSAQLPTGTESFEIHYTGLSFVRPEQVRFRYRLEGLDDDWVEAGTRRAAYYSHVPPGEYTFRLVAANSDGVWNTEGASIRINIAPPFWRTRWFLLLAALSFVALAAYAYRGRVSRLERRQREQERFSRQLIESQERERKRIAGELHDSIGQNLLVIKNRAVMALGAGDEERARKQLDEISATASQSIEEVREIAYDLHPYQLDRLGLTKAIEEMLKRVSGASGIPVSTSIAPLDGVLSKEMEINLFRVVQEGVNNVVKHSGATEAAVSIRTELPLVHVQIYDNGKGFAADADGFGASAGLGLKGIRERVRILGGRCVVNSAPGAGTTIAVTLRAGQQADD
jgi:signal transduction histidine kinase/ligand-binding sensor domain-containing protein